METQPEIKDRVYLNYHGHKLVIEFVEFPLSSNEEDHWRLFDLKEARLICRATNLIDVFHEASKWSCETWSADLDLNEYIEPKYID
jgi:hypothetical protein